MNNLTLKHNVKTEQQKPNSDIEKYDFRFSKINSLIIKVTNRCNLDCAYCYENVSRKGKDMTIDVFKSIIDKTLNSTEDKKVNVIFHGGEPTLLKNEWYLEAVSYAVTKAVELGKEMKFGIQTNLTTLNQNKIDLFKYLNISPGVSIDDPTLSSTSFRQKENLVVKKIELLIKSELKFGVLSTINSSNFNIFREIMLWLKDYKIKNFKANVVYPVGHGFNQKSLTAEEIYYAQKTMLDYMIETNGRCITEDNVAKYLDNYFNANRKQSLCQDKVCGAGSRVVGITTEGDILPCGRFQWNDQEYFLGNLNHNNNEDYNLKVKAFSDKADSNWTNCNDCNASKICGYGCQAFILRSKAQINIECMPTKLIYDYIKLKENELKVVFDNMNLIHYSYKDGYSDEKYSDYSDYSDYNDKEETTLR